MSMTAMIANNAYANAARLAGLESPGAGAAKAADPSAFASLVQSAMESVTEAGKAAEMKSAELAVGKGDVLDVVTAVAETEVALEALVTVRDRVISSYQDILNMPI
ncbi:MAG: flagellar hook-basal body complex protein FliE [Pseudomonadota bacterium]|nr:flagellar hook-basal body complex protein FliE [Pseudomonadota bacterium]